LCEEVDSDTKYGLMPLIDSEFLINMRHQKKSGTSSLKN